MLCVTELQDGAGLAISGSQIRTESWHRITQPVVYIATQLVRGGMSWHPGVSDFKVLPSPFVPMYSKSSLKTSVAFDCTEAGSHVAQVASDSYVAEDDIKLFNLLPQPHRC